MALEVNPSSPKIKNHQNPLYSEIHHHQQHQQQQQQQMKTSMPENMSTIPLPSPSPQNPDVRNKMQVSPPVPSALCTNWANSSTHNIQRWIPPTGTIMQPHSCLRRRSPGCSLSPLMWCEGVIKQLTNHGWEFWIFWACTSHCLNGFWTYGFLVFVLGAMSNHIPLKYRYVNKKTNRIRVVYLT